LQQEQASRPIEGNSLNSRRPNPEVRIRLATVDDALAIAALLYRSFAEYEPLYTRGGFVATTPTPEQIRGRMREGPIWVAAQDGLIVGTVGVAPRGKALYIRSMAVSPEARGEGIGELLLDTIEQFAIGRGYQRLFLSTTPFHTRAIRLYEGQAFRRIQQDQQTSKESRETDSGPHDLFGTPLFTMEKDLTETEARG